MRVAYLLFVLNLSSCGMKQDVPDAVHEKNIAVTDSGGLNPQAAIKGVNGMSANGDCISKVKCPKCQFEKNEKMPTEVCLLSYKCHNCGLEMQSKNGDCCVFCSYGDKRCPSKQ